MLKPTFCKVVIALSVTAAIALSGCGGGDGNRPSMPDGGAMDVALPLPFGHGVSAGEITLGPGESEEHGNVELTCPTGGSDCVITVATDGAVSYERAGGMPTFVLLSPEELPELPAWRPTHAAQAPIIDRSGTLHVGADVAPPADQLTAGQTQGGVATSSGRVQDGTEAGRVIEYLEMHVGASTSSAGEEFTFTRSTTGLPTFSDRPTVRLAAGTSDEFAEHAVRAVQLINAALPYETRIVLGVDPAPALAAIDDIPDGEIFIEFAESAEDWNLANRDFRPGAAAVLEPGPVSEWDPVQQRWEDREMRAAHVWFDVERLLNAAWVLNPDTEEYEETLLDEPVTDADRRVYSEEDIFSILVHELVHALGFLAHNDATRFEDSIMRGDYLLLIQELSTIDSDALLAAYDRFEPGTEPEELSVQSLGAWTDTSFHLLGSLEFPGGEASFGVASRNGRAQPWATGPTPWTELADNRTLSGTVTWNGALLGITPSDETVSGSTRLAIELSTLDGELDFTGLESWGTGAAPGETGQGSMWGDGDLAYSIEVRGNSFTQTGGDDGEVTGVFLGAGHDAMGGVLERSDLSAGFGGTR